MKQFDRETPRTEGRVDRDRCFSGWIHFRGTTAWECLLTCPASLASDRLGSTRRSPNILRMTASMPAAAVVGGAADGRQPAVPDHPIGRHGRQQDGRGTILRRRAPRERASPERARLAGDETAAYMPAMYDHSLQFSLDESESPGEEALSRAAPTA